MPATPAWLRPPVHHFPLLPHLALMPALLAIATAVALFVHSDVNAALLWSQCHSRARMPGVGRALPGLGTPLCFLVSFFGEALDAVRSRAVIAVALAYVGALLAVCTLEAARRCNRRNVVIARPTGWWVLFNLAGGALVWQLVIVPAFIHRARSWFVSEEQPGGGDGRGDGDDADADADADAAREEAEDHDDRDRRIADAEVVAIPVAVALGFYLPSILMLVLNAPEIIGIWLLFPIYVTLLRVGIRWAIQKLRRSEPALVHLESSRWRMAGLYALPVACSVVAHVFVAYAMTLRDDRKEMTRSTVRFIEVDAQFIALTVLYWVFAEVGWRAPLVMVAAAVVLGPGAGVCVGWVYRERLLQEALDQRPLAASDAEEGSAGDGQSNERTPLLG